MTPRPFCADTARDRGEPLGATASHVEHWLAIEYRGAWHPRPLPGSSLSDAVKAHLTAQLRALPRSRLLFIRRPERRHEPTLACFFGVTRERERRFYRVDLDQPSDLLDHDFAALIAADAAPPLREPVFVVCTHGKRDRCCARYGRPVYKELRIQPEADCVWQCTHVGGDRFAGNVVAFPHGLYFGRVDCAQVRHLLDELAAGRIHPPFYRGRSCYPFHVQAAERSVREASGVYGIDDVELLGSEPAGDGWVVRLRANGDVHEVAVEVELGEPVLLTCDAVTAEAPRRYATARHRVLTR